MNKMDRPLDWGNILFLTLSPLIAVVGGAYYGLHYGVRPAEFALFIVMFLATGLSITAGYHRHFAHVSYQAHPWVKIFYLIFGACSFQNSALNWAADHRLHHRFTDTDNDPYNAGRGFWFSHIGWIFYQTPKDRDFTIVGDLQRDRWVRFQHKHNLAIGLVVSLAICLTAGALTHRMIAMFLWVGVIRIVFVHHATFFINSLAHMWGRQPYSRADSSKDSWWLALLTHGEGYHNFHHRFPSDYRNGLMWYQWDPTKWAIAGLNLVGLTGRLHRIPPQLILRARVEVETIEAEKRLQKLPDAVGMTFRERVELARVQFEQSIAQWAETRAKYRDLKNAALQDSEAVLRQWKLKLKEYEARLIEAKEQWYETLQGLRRAPASSI
jgi:stearoyl-CoA desaturase (Delta-9 desaturase)